MAEVGSVYDARPVPRTPDDVLADAHDGEHAARPAPRARNKWLIASVVEGAAAVVSRVFDEAERRDPGRHRTWVALVDGNNHQIDRIEAEARTRQVNVTIVVDFVHVLEYLWKAAWCFYDEGDPDAAIRRKAAREHLDRAARATIDECAAYLARKRPYLDYPAALRRGWPSPPGSSRAPAGT